MLQFITNDFFGGALKVEERIIYATLKDRTTLLSNDADLLEILLVPLYWNPTSPIYNTEEITIQ
jgi:iron complex outermembrane receptor protein